MNHNIENNNNNKRITCTMSQFHDATVGKAITVAMTQINDVIDKIEIISELGYALVIMGCDLYTVAEYLKKQSHKGIPLSIIYHGVSKITYDRSKYQV